MLVEWNHLYWLKPHIWEHRIGWLFFKDPYEIQKDRFNSKVFFPLSFHLGNAHVDMRSEMLVRFGCSKVCSLTYCLTVIWHGTGAI